MRPNQNKRIRGRSNNNNRRGPNPLTRSYESNGPDVKVRGTAAHVAEKYVQLARDAHTSGDPVMAESYLQHAEHYYRLIAAAQAVQNAQAQALATGIPMAESDEVDEDDFDGGVSDRFTFRTPQAYQDPQAVAPQPGNGNGGFGGQEGRNEGRNESRNEGRNEGRAPREGRPDRDFRNEGRDNREPRGERFDRGDRNDRGDRSQNERFGADRGSNDRNQGDRPPNDRQQGERPQGDRPQGDRPNNDRPQGDRSGRDRDRNDFRRNRDNYAAGEQPVYQPDHIPDDDAAAAAAAGEGADRTPREGPFNDRGNRRDRFRDRRDRRDRFGPREAGDRPEQSGDGAVEAPEASIGLPSFITQPVVIIPEPVAEMAVAAPAEAAAPAKRKPASRRKVRTETGGEDAASE